MWELGVGVAFYLEIVEDICSMPVPGCALTFACLQFVQAPLFLVLFDEAVSESMVVAVIVHRAQQVRPPFATQLDYSAD